MGSGLGGDTLSWKRINFRKIVAVEPDAEHLPGLISRIFSILGQTNIEIISRLDSPEKIATNLEKANDRDDRVIIVHTVAQDYDLITYVVDEFVGNPVHVCTSMLSMSFFWENESILDGVINTIVNNLSINGTFMYLTINSDAVIELFEPKFNGPPLDNPLTLGSVKMNYHGDDRTVEILIPDSIVGKNGEYQTEWLVQMDDLVRKLSPYGFYQQDSYRADQEGLLTHSQTILSSLYYYGWFGPERINYNENIYPKERLSSYAEKNMGIIEKLELDPNDPILDPFYDLNYSQEELDRMIKIETDKRNVTAKIISEIESGIGSKSDPTDVSDEETDDVMMTPHLPDYPLDNIFIQNVSVDSRSKEQRLSILLHDNLKENMEKTKISWWNRVPLFRTATIPDGSCFFHTILNGLFSDDGGGEYQTSNDNEKKEMASNLRYDLADDLPSHWESVGGGIWAELSKEQQNRLRQGDQLDPDEIDYSAEGLVNLLKSEEHVGTEFISFISDFYQINVHLLVGTVDDLYPSESSGDKYDEDIFLLFVNDNHYELLATKEGAEGTEGTEDIGTGIKKIYQHQEPFVKAYRSYKLFRSIYDQLMIMYDKFRILEHKNVSDLGIYRELIDYIARGKQIYDQSYNLMLKSSEGLTNQDYEAIMKDELLRISKLTDVVIRDVDSFINET